MSPIPENVYVTTSAGIVFPTLFYGTVYGDKDSKAKGIRVSYVEV